MYTSKKTPVISNTIGKIFISLLIKEEARQLADAMHARELNSVEALETMKRTVIRLEKELDARKRAGDDET